MSGRGGAKPKTDPCKEDAKTDIKPRCISCIKKDFRLRILCLHGYTQCGDQLKQKLGAFRRMVKPYADCEFIDAPHLAIPFDGKPMNQKERSWWSNVGDGSFDGLSQDCPADGFDESMCCIEQTWVKCGPFHGLLGFSQGACLVGIICSLSAQNMTCIKPYFAILASGFESGATVHKSLYHKKKLVKIPSLHIMGQCDELIPKQYSMKLSELFENPEILCHDGGHCMPARAQEKDKYIQFLSLRREEAFAEEQKKKCDQKNDEKNDPCQANQKKSCK